MNLILIAGIPGSGKTTISQKLSHDMGIACLSKDDIKLQLYEKFGFCSIEDKKKLNELAEAQLYTEIQNSIALNADLIVDKWYPETEIIMKHGTNDSINIICIQLMVSAAVAASRYNTRIKNQSRPRVLSILNQYPEIPNVTIYEPFKTEEDMLLRIQKTPEIKNAHSYLCISNDRADIESVYESIKTFVQNAFV